MYDVVFPSDVSAVKRNTRQGRPPIKARRNSMLLLLWAVSAFVIYACTVLLSFLRCETLHPDCERSGAAAAISNISMGPTRQPLSGTYGYFMDNP